MNAQPYIFKGFITQDLNSDKKIYPLDYQYYHSININGMNNVRIDLQVLGFIEQFIHSKARDNNKDNDIELIKDLFKNGYCYYFAHILKIAFNRGEVCICAP